jgi:hypothetical protein
MMMLQNKLECLSLPDFSLGLTSTLAYFQNQSQWNMWGILQPYFDIIDLTKPSSIGANYSSLLSEFTLVKQPYCPFLGYSPGACTIKLFTAVIYLFP